jgi:hypothetical protein
MSEVILDLSNVDWQGAVKPGVNFVLMLPRYKEKVKIRTKL